MSEIQGHILIGRDRIRQVSVDHSVAMELVERGMMTREEARHSILRNRLTLSVGTDETLTPRYRRYEIGKAHTLLVCSDGLWDMLTDEEIRDAVNAGGRAEQICTRLIGMANDAGGHDKITVVVAGIHGG